MNNKQQAIIAELREMTKDLPKGKARRINNYLDYVSLALRGADTRPATHEEVVDNTTEFANQRNAILAYLLKGNTLTSLEAQRLFGASRLPNRIMEIEKVLGKAPARRRITVKNRNGRNVSVCEYWIESN